jgi:hypothetical protein
MKIKNPRKKFIGTVKQLVVDECANYTAGKCWASKNEKCVFDEDKFGCEYFNVCVLPLSGTNRTQVESSISNRKELKIPVNSGLTLNSRGHGKNWQNAMRNH